MIKTTWGNSLVQLGFMKQNGKARDRRVGNKICRKEKSATVGKKRHPKVREKKRQRGE